MPLPPFTEKNAIQLLAEHYGLTATAKSLPGDIDRNFLVFTSSEKFVLKIHALETPLEDIAFQNAALQHLSEFGGVPRVIPTRDGEEIFVYAEKYLVRMVSYLEGALLESIVPKPPNLLRDLGSYLAKLDLALADFTHPAMKRKMLWDLSLAHLAIEPRLDAIASAERRDLASHVLVRFKERVLPILPDLQKQVIHNDANTQNLLVQDGMISGIFDFGDLLYAPRIHEVAICAAYALLGEENPLVAAAHLVAGYHSLSPLTATEISLLYDLICARLAVSASISSERLHAHQKETGAPPLRGELEGGYHQTHAKPAWEALAK